LAKRPTQIPAAAAAAATPDPEAHRRPTKQREASASQPRSRSQSRRRLRLLDASMPEEEDAEPVATMLPPDVALLLPLAAKDLPPAPTPELIKMLAAKYNVEVLSVAALMGQPELSVWVDTEKHTLAALKHDLAMIRNALSAALLEVDAVRMDHEARLLPEADLHAAAMEAQRQRNDAFARGPAIIETDVVLAAIASRQKLLADFFPERTARERKAVVKQLHNLELLSPALADLLAERTALAGKVVSASEEFSEKLEQVQDVEAALRAHEREMAEEDQRLAEEESEWFSEEAVAAREAAIAEAELTVRRNVANDFTPGLVDLQTQHDARLHALQDAAEERIRKDTAKIDRDQHESLNLRMVDLQKLTAAARSEADELQGKVDVVSAELSKIKNLARLKAKVRRMWATLETETIVRAFGVPRAIVQREDTLLSEQRAAERAEKEKARAEREHFLSIMKATLAKQRAALELEMQPSSPEGPSASSKQEKKVAEQSVTTPTARGRRPARPISPSGGKSILVHVPSADPTTPAAIIAAAATTSGSNATSEQAKSPPVVYKYVYDAKTGRRVRQAISTSFSGTAAPPTTPSVPQGALTLPVAQLQEDRTSAAANGATQPSSPQAMETEEDAADRDHEDNVVDSSDEESEEEESIMTGSVAIARRCINAFISSAVKEVEYDTDYLSILTVAQKVATRHKTFFVKGLPVPPALHLRNVISKILATAAASTSKKSRSPGKVSMAFDTGDDGDSEDNDTNHDGSDDEDINNVPEYARSALFMSSSDPLAAHRNQVVLEEAHRFLSAAEQPKSTDHTIRTPATRLMMAAEAARKSANAVLGASLEVDHSLNASFSKPPPPRPEVPARAASMSVPVVATSGLRSASTTTSAAATAPVDMSVIKSWFSQAQTPTTAAPQPESAHEADRSELAAPAPAPVPTPGPASAPAAAPMFAPEPVEPLPRLQSVVRANPQRPAPTLPASAGLLPPKSEEPAKEADPATPTDASKGESEAAEELPTASTASNESVAAEMASPVEVTPSATPARPTSMSFGRANPMMAMARPAVRSLKTPSKPVSDQEPKMAVTPEQATAPASDADNSSTPLSPSTLLDAKDIPAAEVQPRSAVKSVRFAGGLSTDPSTGSA
jgi:hypothetical protein